MQLFSPQNTLPWQDGWLSGSVPGGTVFLDQACQTSPTRTYCTVWNCCCLLVVSVNVIKKKYFDITRCKAVWSGQDFCELRETWKLHIYNEDEKPCPAEMMMHFEDSFWPLDGWYRKHQLRPITAWSQFSTRALTLMSLCELQYNPQTLW